MIKVTIVTLKGCPHCENVRRVLNKLKPEYNLEIKDIDVDTPEGKKYVEKYKLTGAPAIFINDAFFKQGEASEQEFKEKFASI